MSIIIFREKKKIQDTRVVTGPGNGIKNKRCRPPTSSQTEEGGVSTGLSIKNAQPHVLACSLCSLCVLFVFWGSGIRQNKRKWLYLIEF